MHQRWTCGVAENPVSLVQVYGLHQTLVERLTCVDGAQDRRYCCVHRLLLVRVGVVVPVRESPSEKLTLTVP
jgi:hypothetical protein